MLYPIGQLAKAWFDLEVAHPTRPLELAKGDEQLNVAMESYHSNGKNEAMTALLNGLYEGGHISSDNAIHSYIEEGCIEFGLVHVAVCDANGLDHYLQITFDGKVSHL